MVVLVLEVGVGTAVGCVPAPSQEYLMIGMLPLGPVYSWNCSRISLVCLY